MNDNGRLNRLALFALCLGLGWWLWKGIFCLQSPPCVEGPASHYIAAAGKETGAANIVAAILFDYRAFDTLGEVTVIFTTVCGVSMLFARSRYHKSSSGLSFVVRRGMALVVPFILLYASSIIVMGHLTPGGGFQGGTVLATATILFCIVYGSSFEAARVHPTVKEAIESTGALLFTGIGLIGLCAGAGFLANAKGGFPIGTSGSFLSAGAIPILNVAVGMKVGAGLSTLFYSMVKILETPVEDLPPEV